ncbi:Gfo/Idh/MocA family protein [Fontivita pretiosa]|uniref:Gfo/Idh/MocA family protein n=1 Tax=Fontivita pretiosa TaxID=2989684 RepID=UPI003D168647
MAVQRLAMIGARGHYNYALRALPDLPQVRLVAVADGADDDPATPIVTWASQHGHQPRVFADYRQMLDQALPDAVIVCGPFERHAEMTIQAIERGIHVFVEKPAALTFEELEQLRAAQARNPQVHLAGMMGIRYDPGFYTAWKLIRNGAIGDVRLLNARKSYKLGRRPSYYHDRRSYGGTIPWVGSHAIDWILWMSGEKVERIYARHSSRANENHGTMERAAVCELGLSDERFASISIDIFRPARAPSHGDDWIRVVGTRGVIEARNNSLCLINDENDGTQPVPVTSDRQVFRDFVDHIDGRRPGLIDARQTLVLTEVCLLARQSADEGGRVIEIPGERELRFPQE